MEHGVRYEFVSRDSKFELDYHIDSYIKTNPSRVMTAFQRVVPMRRKKK